MAVGPHSAHQHDGTVQQARQRILSAHCSVGGWSSFPSLATATATHTHTLKVHTCACFVMGMCMCVFLFLFVCVCVRAQSFPAISPIGPASSIAPLVFVLTVTAFKDALEDWVRSATPLFFSFLCLYPSLLCVPSFLCVSFLFFFPFLSCPALLVCAWGEVRAHVCACVSPPTCVLTSCAPLWLLWLGLPMRLRNRAFYCVGSHALLHHPHRPNTRVIVS